MIKFLGNTMEWIDGKYYFNGEYVGDIDYFDEPRVFAPRECGESCLMTGSNKPNYETFLDQESFLKNTYILMHIDNPEEFYEIIKRNINDKECILICEKCLEETSELRQGVTKCFLQELKSYVEHGFNISSYYFLCANNKFSIQLIKKFLQEKDLLNKRTNNGFVAKRKSLYKKRNFIN